MTRIGIYTITSPSGKVYVGQTWNAEQRWRQYRRCSCDHQIKLLRSLKKYGPENHKIEMVFEMPNTISQTWLDYCEDFFMRFFKNKGVELLNLKGAGAYGKHGEETKAKMRLQRIGLNKGKKHSEIARKNMSLGRMGEKNHNFGKPKSAETKLKMSAAKLGKKWATESKLKLSSTKKLTMLGPNNHFYGKKHSPDSIEKMKLAHRNTWKIKKTKLQNALEV